MSPFADEDEKTTIESGWEEEASTTVEQGEVAEKIRTLGLRPITNVTGSTSGGQVLDEPTMDDQHAAGLSLITPPMLQARMIITAGNDQGQEIEIVPGKTYTVGRAIDNDIVLTDIAVSRKHFDLRFENAAWVLVDRGSGNGTVINGAIEDAPFMLANGDSIEIGNTTFRFDNPNGMARHNPFNENIPTSGYGTGGFAVASDVVTRDGALSFDSELEEEPSTVVGKPLREVEHPPQPMFARSESPRAPAQPPRAMSARPELPRPKTVPPPMPPPAPLPRPKPPTSAPPFNLGSMPPMAPPMSSPALPQPQMLVAPPPAYQGVHGSQPVPAIGPHRATMLAGQGPSQEQVLQNVMPTTIPGQGPPMGPSNPQLHALPFTYPNMAEHAQHAHNAQAKMLVVSQNQLPPRDATATAHVPPTPYNGLPVMQPYVAPSLSRRTKLLLAGAGLTLITAIATIAIIKGSSSGEATQSESETPVVDEGKQTTTTKPVVEPIEPKKEIKKDPPKKDPPKKDPPKDSATKLVDAPKDPPKEIKKDPPKEIVKKDPPKDPPKEIKKDPPPKEIKKDPPKEVVKKDPPKPRDTRVAVAATTVKKDPPPANTGALDKAKALYGQKKFLEAATAANAADKNVGATYSNLAKAYAAGMRQSAQGLDAYGALRSAISYDTQLGGLYVPELRTKQAEVAKSAAVSYVARGALTNALDAVKLAESAGKDASTERRLITSKARELYDAAVEEMDTNKAAAVAKLRQVIAVLPPGNTLLPKAQNLLAKNGG